MLATLKGYEAAEAKAKADGSAQVSIDGTSFEIKASLIACETKKEVKHVEVFVPNVVEPSFGIDRILTAIYEHAFYARKEEGAAAEEATEAKADKKKKKGGKEEAKGPVAGVLGLPAEIAPYKVCLTLLLPCLVLAEVALQTVCA